MKIVVLIKKTFDTEAKLKISADGSRLEEAGAKWIISPYDEYALEEAIALKEKKFTNAEVVVMSFSDDSMKELMVKALGMGCDRAVLISTAQCQDAGALEVAKVLAAAIKAEGAALVFAGRHAIDDDNMHVPAMVAELLAWPHVNVVNKFEAVSETSFKAERSIEGGRVESYEISGPCIVGADKSLNKPRFVSLPGIMKAKKKPIDLKNVSDLGLSAADLLPKVKTVKIEFPPEKPKGKVFKGESVDVMVAKVVDLLRSEAKVI